MKTDLYLLGLLIMSSISCENKIPIEVKKEITVEHKLLTEELKQLKEFVKNRHTKSVILNLGFKCYGKTPFIEVYYGIGRTKSLGTVSFFPALQNGEKNIFLFDISDCIKNPISNNLIITVNRKENEESNLIISSIKIDVVDN